MSTTDWLILAQTVVLFVTALIVLFYTIETHKIRKETHIQNSLLAEQLTILQETIKFEKNKEASFIKPIFRSTNSSRTGDKVEMEFINQGGHARLIKIEPLGNFSAELPYQKEISQNQRSSFQLVKVPQPIPEKLYFRLYYQDKLGNNLEQKFVFEANRGQFIEAKE
jgi:hypothetical protein